MSITDWASEVYSKSCTYKKISLFICFTLIILFLGEKDTKADNPISVHVDGHELQDISQYTTLQNGRVYVPFRVLAEQIGANISWDNEQKRITLSRGQRVVEFWIGSKEYLVNGAKHRMDASPFIYQSRTLVPVRFVAGALDFNVRWDASTQSVILNHIGKKHTFNEDDVYWLAKIIYTEASGEPMDGQIAVGAVVVNRVKDSSFPNTIYDVIHDRQGGYVQFEPVLNGEINRHEPNDTAYEAAKRALAGEDPTNGTLFFHNPSISQSSWMAVKPVSTTIGKHVFMY